MQRSWLYCISKFSASAISKKAAPYYRKKENLSKVHFIKHPSWILLVNPAKIHSKRLSKILSSATLLFFCFNLFNKQLFNLLEYFREFGIHFASGGKRSTASKRPTNMWGFPNRQCRSQLLFVISEFQLYKFDRSSIYKKKDNLLFGFQLRSILYPIIWQNPLTSCFLFII